LEKLYPPIAKKQEMDIKKGDKSEKIISPAKK
jgi:hypothetical protein